MVLEETKQVEEGTGKILQEELQDKLLSAISLYKEAVEENTPYRNNARKYLFSFVEDEENEV